MKRTLTIVALLLAAGASCLSAAPSKKAAASPKPSPSVQPSPTPPAGKTSFSEVWAYLMEDEEDSLNPSWPVSDVGYFGAGINASGKLVGVPDRTAVRRYKGRVHLVVDEVGSYMATHFVMDPDLPLRSAFIDALAEAAAPFDGVQIDFETVLSKDKENFYSFLADLRARLAGKVFSIAVPALVSDSLGIWEYARLDKAADRIVVMAYDEHWSGSDPGSVASLDWCRKVAAYAQTRIAPERLVMGIPFYGRAWADKNLSKAYRFTSVDRLRGESGVGEAQRENGIPCFEYSATVKVKVYYEDSASLATRMGLYNGMGVSQVSFWRLGQEDPDVWTRVGIASR